MKYPLSTGQAAAYLGVAEPRLNDLVRRGKIDPAPPVLAGRRLWEAEHVRQAAEELGVGPEDQADRADPEREGGAS